MFKQKYKHSETFCKHSLTVVLLLGIAMLESCVVRQDGAAYILSPGSFSLMIGVQYFWASALFYWFDLHEILLLP